MQARAMVLAAGFGTRLRPLTEERPKPLIPVANRPLIDYSLAQLQRAGIRQVAVNTHHLGEQIPQALGTGAAFDLEITYSPEEEILGTGGGVVRLRSFLDGGTFFVLNGDVLSGVDLAEVLAFHRQRGAAATMVVRPLPPGESYTALTMDEAGYLVGFKGVRRPARGAERPCMFCGIHVLEPVLFDHLPGSGFSCINDVGYTAMLEQGLDVAAFPYRGPWFDLGTPARYLEASAALVSGQARLAQLPELAAVGGVLQDASAAVDPSARIEGPAVIGPGCRVGPRAHLRDVILWPGATVRADESLEHAIVSAANRVVL